MTLVSFLVFLSAFVGIGIASVYSRKSTRRDYLLANHDVSPWLVGLSAVATNNSGYMFTGVIGYTYTAGLQAIWLMVGWIAGDLAASFVTHRKLRDVAGEQETLTFAGALSRWSGDNFQIFRALAGLIGLVFLGAYAAAQFNAGSKALQVLFGWNIHIGAVVGSAVVLLYCVAGGIRASIWTDAAQAIVMVVAMAILLVVGLDTVGGFDAAMIKLQVIGPAFNDWFPQEMRFGDSMGPLLFVIGWFFAGVGVIGQPHIMVRFMSLRQPQLMTRARWYYYGWFIIFYGLATGVGMLSRLLISGNENFDAETALPLMAQQLLPEVLVGLILAGIFAATISTADSLILSCSASVTTDISPKTRFSYGQTKAVTVVIVAAALAIAVFGDQSVFQLVVFSWGVLAAAFGPPLLLHTLGARPNEVELIITCLAGVMGIFLWRALELSQEMYEILPAFLTAFAVFGLVRLARRFQPTPRQT